MESSQYGELEDYKNVFLDLKKKFNLPINSSAKTVVFDSSCTQSIAIVGVSAIKTLLKLFATLKMDRIENKLFNCKFQVQTLAPCLQQ